MKFTRFGFGLVALGALVLAGGAGIAQQGPPGAAGPPRGKGPTPEATETPEPPQFSTLDGIWEVQEQPIFQQTVYSHLSVVQSGTTLGGYWEHGPNHLRSPLTGTFDGRLFSISVDLGSGKTATMSGYCENFSDLVGMLHLAANDAGTAFTATHRKRERTISGS